MKETQPRDHATLTTSMSCEFWVFAGCIVKHSNKKQCRDTVDATSTHHLVWGTKFGEHDPPAPCREWRCWTPKPWNSYYICRPPSRVKRLKCDSLTYRGRRTITHANAGYTLSNEEVQNDLPRQWVARAWGKAWRRVCASCWRRGVSASCIRSYASGRHRDAWRHGYRASWGRRAETCRSARNARGVPLPPVATSWTILTYRRNWKTQEVHLVISHKQNFVALFFYRLIPCAVSSS